MPERPVVTLDTRQLLETPEGIDLALNPAGLMPRSLAFVMDLLLRGMILLLIMLLASALGNLGSGLIALAIFLVSWWYPVLFEVLNQGRTPGKMLLRLRVVHDDGSPIGWSASLIRNLLRGVDMLPLCYATAAVTCLTQHSFKRLGDIAAGTLVVYQHQAKVRPTLPDVPALAAPCPLLIEEQRALLSFAERHSSLSSARCEELAEIVALPLQCSQQQAQEHLYGIAQGLVGKA